MQIKNNNIDIIRPTKRQQEMLLFITDFIKEHGYSPSYREIMTGLNYTSVATVAVHVNSLIKRGHLIKRDRSARSLELTANKDLQKIVSNQTLPAEEKWLVRRVEYLFKQVEDQVSIDQNNLDALLVLIGALKILGFEGAASSFSTRLKALKLRVTV